MNATKKIIIGSILAAACSLASASAITTVVMGALKVTAGSPGSGTFNATTEGYVAGTPISSGTVSFTVSNINLDHPSLDLPIPPGGGTVTYTIGSGGTPQQDTVGTGPTVIVLNPGSLSDLMDDGMLDLVLSTDDQGGFNVSGPILEIHYDTPNQRGNDVPEPASLGLLGIALLGMSAIRRKQQ